MRRLAAGLLALFACGPGPEPAPEPRRIDAGRLGSVRLFEPSEPGAALVYNGQKIGLCCHGCEETFRKDPETYFKKAQQNAKKQ